MARRATPSVREPAGGGRPSGARRRLRWRLLMALVAPVALAAAGVQPARAGTPAGFYVWAAWPLPGLTHRTERGDGYLAFSTEPAAAPATALRDEEVLNVLNNSSVTHRVTSVSIAGPDAASFTNR